MIIKIQSFIDIITNSSTEVFSIPTYISEFQYIIVPIKQNVDMTLIYKINEILEGFPHRTYDILENCN